MAIKKAPKKKMPVTQSSGPAATKANPVYGDNTCGNIPNPNGVN